MATTKGLKCTWTNGVIWSGIMLAVGVGIRWLLWFLFIFAARPEGMDYLYTESEENIFLGSIIVTCVLAVIFFIINYSGYMRIANRHADSLRDVAHGRYGRPWVLPLILYAVLGFLWSGGVIFALDLMKPLVIVLVDDEYNEVISNIPLYRMVGLATGTFLLDIVMYAVGARYFKPDLVQRNQT